MLTKPPLPLLVNHQTDNASKEHHVKDAATKTNKKTIIYDPNVIKRLRRVTSGSIVGTVLMANNSSQD